MSRMGALRTLLSGSNGPALARAGTLGWSFLGSGRCQPTGGSVNLVNLIVKSPSHRSLALARTH